MKKSAQRRRKHCALAVVRRSQKKIRPAADPLPGGGTTKIESAGDVQYFYLQTQFGEDRCTQFRVIVVTGPPQPSPPPSSSSSSPPPHHHQHHQHDHHHHHYHHNHHHCHHHHRHRFCLTDPRSTQVFQRRTYGDRWGEILCRLDAISVTQPTVQSTEWMPNYR